MPITSVVEVARSVIERSASLVWVLIVVVSCSTRWPSMSAAALLRISISLVTFSARPRSSSSKRPMRVSRLLATSIARLTERLVDVVDLGAERVGELGAAHVDDRGHVADALVERADDFLAAIGQRLGDVDDAGAERVVERLGAAVERVLEADELLVEAGRDLGRLGGDAGVEVVEIVAHRAR